MSFYEQKILPHLIDFACSDKSNRKQREKIVPSARGDVLEVGFGSGLNLAHYDRQKVTRVWALEPSEGMRRKAEPNVAAAGMSVEWLDLPGEQIPLPDASVDTVLVTYTLCTIPDAKLALKGMRRVLKPDGQLLFCEHGIAPDGNVVRWQNRINPLWRRVAGGCNLNRDIPAMIVAGGFDITSMEQMYIPGPRPLCYNYWGEATRQAGTVDSEDALNDTM